MKVQRFNYRELEITKMWEKRKDWKLSVYQEVGGSNPSGGYLLQCTWLDNCMTRGSASGSVRVPGIRAEIGRSDIHSRHQSRIHFGEGIINIRRLNRLDQTIGAKPTLSFYKDASFHRCSIYQNTNPRPQPGKSSSDHHTSMHMQEQAGG
jgi:hypothetical protein